MLPDECPQKTSYLTNDERAPVSSQNLEFWFESVKTFQHASSVRIETTKTLPLSVDLWL